MKYFPLLSVAVVGCAVPDPHSEEAHGRKVMGLQEKFDRFDYNGDGRLTRREIEQGIAESGVSGLTKEEIDAAMEHYDVDKDGAISRWETQRAIDMPLPDHS